jgi:glycine betaine catabolism A
MTTGEKLQILQRLQACRPGTALPGAFYSDAGLFDLDMAGIYYREWIFAGHDCEIPQPGDFITMQLGAYALILTRDADGALRCHHNTCRHRGYKICDTAKGNVKRRFVCPYHQWSYDLDGRLAIARAMKDDVGFDASAHGLKSAHIASAGGHIFVCVAAEAPDFAPVRAMVEPYLLPFDLRNAKIAFESTIVENGNWKLVMENNRECYHCAGSHPELCRTFPEAPTHTGTGSPSTKEAAEIASLAARCEAQGLPSRYQLSADAQYRIMRMPLLDGARSMTMTGRPAVARPLHDALPKTDIGDVLLFHFPSTWNHFTADHAISFRVLPLSADRTQLTSKWLVHKDAVEGRDYDLKTLTEVWLATNSQDTALVERNHLGIQSPAYEPGPYSQIHEDGVIQFVDWYKARMIQWLSAAQTS